MAAASPAGGELVVSLKAAERQDARRLAYAAAELTIDNSDGSVARVIRAAAIRCADGGPTFVYPLNVAPRTRRSLAVTLPALSVRQEVDVRLLAGEAADSTPLASRRVVINWPEQLISRAGARLIDPDAYEAWRRENSPASWPAGPKRNVFLTLVLAGVLAAAALLVRRAALRLAAIAVIVPAAALVVLFPLAAAESVIVGDFQYEPLTPTVRPAQKMLAVQCLRTTDWAHPDSLLVPVYRSAEQMAADNMLVRLGQGIEVTLRANKLRLFRRARAVGGYCPRLAAACQSCPNLPKSAQICPKLPSCAQIFPILPVAISRIRLWPTGLRF
ncbi:MAG: hypothetical protein ACYTF6_13900 [Planctomycetota bacterium]